MKLFTDKAKYVGRSLLTDEFINNPQVIGNYLEKLFVTMYKLDIYDPPSVSQWSGMPSMPEDWHLLYRELYPYFRAVKKSRKKPRKSRDKQPKPKR